MHEKLSDNFQSNFLPNIKFYKFYIFWRILFLAKNLAYSHIFPILKPDKSFQYKLDMANDYEQYYKEKYK